MTEEEDAALLEAVARGSERAFNMLVDRHQQAIRAFLRGVVGPNEADDIAQETFLTLWSRAKSYKGETSVRSWLFSIAWRKAKGSQRRWFRSRRRDTSYHEVVSANEAETVDAADLQAIEQALARLTTEQRGAVMLCLGCGLSHGEASAALDIPLGTLKSHVLRGREQLRATLSEDAHE